MTRKNSLPYIIFFIFSFFIFFALYYLFLYTIYAGQAHAHAQARAYARGSTSTKNFQRVLYAGEPDIRFREIKLHTKIVSRNISA